ncbi:MAG: tyrosine-type recombinase/integrase [Solirubrobacteraceae bacterium]|jgi:integrase/recombinase XerC
MPQTQETFRLAPGLPRAVVELPMSESDLAVAASSPADRVALGAMQAALAVARETGEDRPALEILAGSLAEMGVRARSTTRSARLLTRDRDAWLRRLRSAERSASSLSAYRYAIDDLLSWAAQTQRTGELFEEQAIVDYLDDYRTRCEPAPATYHRRFLLLRRFMAWVSQRNGLPDPFSELQAPPKPRQEAEWLTREEFARMLHAAANPKRAHPGIAERDGLVLLTLAMTGLRRSELIALDWSDVTLDGERPSLLVRRGKGGKPRRQPLPGELAAALERSRATREPGPSDPVFCGLGGGRLQPTILAGIIRRASDGAGISKHVTAHTLRHTAATWLRQATGDTRLVAEYLGHADLSTVARYAHVASEELHAAAQSIAEGPGEKRTSAPPPPPGASSGQPERVHPGQLSFE